MEKFNSPHQKESISIRQIAELVANDAMNLKLSYSSKSVVYAGVTPDDFMTNLRVKRVHHDGVNALAFYFHNIKKIGG